MRKLVLILVVVAVWLAGLIAFADRVVESTPALEPEIPSDAIVVLTGKSDMRIREGMRLLERRKGKRLLISGVNREVTRKELLAVSEGSHATFDCCVDLGYEAENTVGNATEISDWVHAKGFKSLIVVTSDYHMPRALLELKDTLPGMVLHPFPVATPELEARSWWRSSKSLRLVLIEYHKYLVILSRDLCLNIAHVFDKKPAAKPAGLAIPAGQAG